MRASELVAAAMQAVGIEPPDPEDPQRRKVYTEAARRIGLPNYHDPQKLRRRWLRGENEPDFQATLILLEVAGLLAPEPVTTSRLAALPGPDRRALAVTQAELLLRILRQLDVDEATLQPQTGHGEAQQ